MTERGLKNINVFIQRLQTFFLIFVTFLRFLTVFYFIWNVFFTSMVLSINIYLHQNTWIYLAIVDSLLVFSLAYLKRRQANAELYSAKRNVDGLAIY